MLKALFSLIGLWSFAALAANCDCEVKVFAPSTASAKMRPTLVKTYKLQSYDTLKVKNQLQCRESCLSRFHEDFTSESLNQILVGHTQNLISTGVLGYNCTGLTTLKYPLRMKAKLGTLPLGNVIDQIEVVTHEQVCFNF